MVAIAVLSLSTVTSKSPFPPRMGAGEKKRFWFVFVFWTDHSIDYSDTSTPNPRF